MFDLNRPLPPTRETVVTLARQEVGESDASKYWRDVLPSSWRGPYPKEWCGAFALAMLRRAGLAQWDWEVGKGFLWRLKRTDQPQVGDCGYLDQPYQHHFLFDREADGWVYSVDGNQPDVRERKRRRDTVTAFYSIETLLGDQSEATTPPALPTIWLGHAPMSVTGHLQTLLNRHGASLIVDGRFGPKTDLATRQFQAANDLTADGIVTAKLWEELER